MTEVFTQKEMLIRVLDKLEKIEIKINGTHELASNTNGKVKMHTKIISGIVGVLVTLIGWIVLGGI